MPLYEYACDACGHKFEKIQKFSDPLESQCPKCGSPVRKLMSSPAIQFKGTGFYITDYVKKEQGGSKTEKPAGEKSDAAAASKSEKSDGAAKTETTPAASSSSDSSSPSSSSTTAAKSTS